MKKTLLTILMLVAATSAALAQTGNKTNFGQMRVTNSAEEYDRLIAELKESHAVASFDQFYSRYINIDLPAISNAPANTPTEQLYAERLKLMATEIQLPYNNIVRQYIDLFTRPQMLERLLGRAQYYFPIFEEELYRTKMPMELKILPVVESALQPTVVSYAAAAGLWQIIPPTARSYGLEINSFVDERCDPIKSTQAACKYLRDLHARYNDWTLAIAAYNCGPGKVNQALALVPDAKTYWDIYEYLPHQTRTYVPAFIGATYAFTYHKAHGLNPIPFGHTLATDTLQINRMMHFEQISSTIGLEMDVLRALNPQYLLDIIPAKDKEYTLVLPQRDFSKFAKNQDAIFAKDTLYLTKYLKVDDINKVAQIATERTTTRSQITYKVKSGDTLGAIAKNHKVTVKDIQKWNGMKNTRIREGQKLTIYKK